MFELAREILGIERKQRLSVRATLVPDDARLAAWKRQDREWARGEKMLLRPSLVIALMGNRRDNAGLVIVPSDGLNVGELGEFRARAVGGDREARAQPPPSDSPSSPTCLPGAQWTTDAVTR